MISKQGSMGMAIIFAVFIFIIGMTVVNLIMPEVTNFRVGMDCSNSAGISDATKLTCLAGDVTIPYFILLVFSVAGGFLVEKLAL